MSLELSVFFKQIFESLQRVNNGCKNKTKNKIELWQFLHGQEFKS